MIEIRCGFDSFPEFREWQHQHRKHLPHWVDALVGDIRIHGLFEPLSNAHYAPHEITIDLERLPVSLEAGGLNSRKRAGLLAVQSAVAALPPSRQRSPKILGAEGVDLVARVLRAAYPYYLPTEFLPTEAERAHCYPIRHLDLMKVDLPAESFDIFFSAHVLEHVPDIARAIHEVERILKPDGILISTYPFAANRVNTITKARLVKGRVEHLTEPEYHGNPMRPDEGSLVFQLPGWDILDMCRAAGLTDAKLLLIASTRHGVVASGSVGLFALFARKPAARGARETGKLEHIEYTGPYF